MLIGYARVSTQDQHLHLQEDALQKACCEKIFKDIASGAKWDRPGLLEALKHARQGDTLIVWKLDRLGRSIKDLIETVNSLQTKGIGFKCLQENIDTTTSSGKLIFHIFSALAEFERSIIRERTQAGLIAARARGRKGGRPPAMDQRQIKIAHTLYTSQASSIAEIYKTLKISKTTLYKYLKLKTNRHE